MLYLVVRRFTHAWSSTRSRLTDGRAHRAKFVGAGWSGDKWAKGSGGGCGGEGCCCVVVVRVVVMGMVVVVVVVVVVVESSWWWVTRHESFFDVGLLFSSGGRDPPFHTLGICFGAFTGERVMSQIYHILAAFFFYVLRYTGGYAHNWKCTWSDRDYHCIKYISILYKTAECGCGVHNLGCRRLRFWLARRE